ncbi:MAG TPA: hypothetical protein VJY15_14640 [Candidatus Acidoferrum sp.]|nr:hypothetical protein [Candidatus Acidoferrum sp.]
MTSIFAVTSLLPSLFYRTVARLAGVHLCNDRDDTLYASRSYLTLNADGPGPQSRSLTWRKAKPARWQLWRRRRSA